jgi:hypothetical protein
MRRVAQLIRTARGLRRRIWASLSFAERFAQVVTRLASVATDAFGSGMYGIFLEHGIQEMPLINGILPEEWNPKKALPTHYGREFGQKCFLSLMRKFHKPDVVEDLMSTFLVRFLERAGQYLDPQTSLREAEAYVLRSLYNEGLNAIRRKRWETPESAMNREDDEGGGDSVFHRILTREDEKIMGQLLKSPAMIGQLRRIHPSAEQYLRLSLQGYDDVEILGNSGKPPMLEHATNAQGGALTPTAWNKYKNLIYQALKSGYEDAVAV